MPEIFAGRIVSKDDEFVLLEVGRTDAARFTLRGGDAFLTMQFVRHDALHNRIVVYDPFKEVQ